MGNSRFETEDWSKPKDNSSNNKFITCLCTHIDTDPDGILGYPLYVGWDGLASFYLTDKSKDSVIIKDYRTLDQVKKFIDQVDDTKFYYDCGAVTVIHKSNFSFTFV